MKLLGVVSVLYNYTIDSPANREPPDIECFCTQPFCSKHHCEGTFCLIGFTKKAKIVKACSPAIPGNRPIVPSCYRSFGLWSEICLCADPFCNRFGMFRDDFKHFKLAAPGQSGGQNLTHSSRRMLLRHLNSYAIIQAKMDAAISEDETAGGPLSGTRGKLFKSELAAILNDSHSAGGRNSYLFTEDGNSHDNHGRNELTMIASGKNLPILLVIIPLAIGAVAVVLVMTNYYCKQC